MITVVNIYFQTTPTMQSCHCGYSGWLITSKAGTLTKVLITPRGFAKNGLEYWRCRNEKAGIGSTL